MKTSGTINISAGLLCGMLTVFGVSFTSAQDALPVGQAVEGAINGEELGAVYVFDAPEPGMLSLAVRGTGDLYLEVRSEKGHALPGGYSDQDLFGDVGSEQSVVAVERAGEVRVHVASHGDPGKFTLVSGFVAAPMLANHDEDSRPDGAMALPVSGIVGDSINPADGDRMDVFKVQGGEGLVVVSTTSRRGDVSLSATAAPAEDGADHADGGFGMGEIMEGFGELAGMMDFMDDAWFDPGYGDHYSDHDFGGDTGREALVVYLEPDGAYYVTVSSSDGDPVDYTIICVRVTTPVGLAQAPQAEEPAGGKLTRVGGHVDEAPQPEPARAPRAPH